MFNSKSQIKMNLQTLWFATLFLLTPLASQAVEVYLVADEQSWTAPDATVVPMWGYQSMDVAAWNDYNCTTASPPWVPPNIIRTAAAGDTLTVHLKNCLAEATSLLIPGLIPTIVSPVVETDLQGRGRVVSFLARTNAAESGEYSWRVKNGTFLLESGDSLAKQVQMGLYASLVINSGVVEAYPASQSTSGRPLAPVVFDQERTLLYSEIDPAHHTGATFIHPLDYKPKYFLINGKVHTQAAPNLLENVPNPSNVLLRFINASPKPHSPVLGNGAYMNIITDDANRLPYPMRRYSIQLPAGKTADALLTATGTRMSIIDRTGGLSNNGAFGGGMLIYLPVESPALP